MFPLPEKSESGQGLAEVALFLVLVVVVAAVVLGNLGDRYDNMFQLVVAAFQLSAGIFGG
jgi:hypothetical protein